MAGARPISGGSVCARVALGGELGLTEDGGQFPSLSEQPFEGGVRGDLRGAYHLEPVDAFVRFLDDVTNLDDEICVRSSPTCGAVVRADASAGTEQLIG